MSGKVDHVILAIQKHFPDMVDILEIARDPANLGEALVVTESLSPVASARSVEELDEVLQIRSCEIILSEIEPETGIYAAMSPNTHRVYVWFDRRMFTDAST